MSPVEVRPSPFLMSRKTTRPAAENSEMMMAMATVSERPGSPGMNMFPLENSVPVVTRISR